MELYQICLFLQTEAFKAVATEPPVDI